MIEECTIRVVVSAMKRAGLPHFKGVSNKFHRTNIELEIVTHRKGKRWGNEYKVK